MIFLKVGSWINGDGWIWTTDQGLMSPAISLKLINKLSVSRLAELSNTSKAYVSQVKSGKRPPSEKFLSSISQSENSKTKQKLDLFKLFLQSRKANGVTDGSYIYYRNKLSRFLAEINLDKAQETDIQKFLLKFPNAGNKHAYFRVIRTFYNWRERTFALPNPIRNMSAPITTKLIMPSLSAEQVNVLIEKASSVRDKAIIALFVESGLRLSELANIQMKNIDWESYTIQVIGKGRKEALSPFGSLSESLLKQWITEYKPEDKLWNLNSWGITTMLRRLEHETGIKCNPHTFRRTFACLLRKAGVDTMTIKDLGRWESLTMVQRYTRSVNFQDSLKFYKAPLG